MARQEIIFDPPESMQDALTKVNENFQEIYNNPETLQDTKTSDFNVSSNIEFYFVDCSSNDITATFDLSTYGKRKVCFIRIDNSDYKFYIDEVSGSVQISGNPVPYDTTGYLTLNIISNNSNLYIY